MATTLENHRQIVWDEPLASELDPSIIQSESELKGSETRSSVISFVSFRKDDLQKIKEGIKGFDPKQSLDQIVETYDCLLKIAGWLNDPETRKHIDPAMLPLGTEEGGLNIIEELARYYAHPDLITRLLLAGGKPVGVASLRANDRYVVKMQELTGRTDLKIISGEGSIIDPDARRRGYGSELTQELIKIAYEAGYDEMRVWAMVDRESGNWDVNLSLIRKAGFQIVQDYPTWKSIAPFMNEETNGRDGLWMVLPKEHMAKTLGM